MELSIVFFMAILVANAASQDSPSRTKCSDSATWLATLNGLEVDKCDEGKQCLLVKGTDSTITLKFTPKVSVETVRSRVHGIIAGAAIPYDVPETNFCGSSGIECPLQKNATVTYVAKLPIKPFYPTLGLTVKWELIDRDANTVVCVLIPVKIVNQKDLHTPHA